MFSIKTHPNLPDELTKITHFTGAKFKFHNSSFHKSNPKKIE